MAGSKITILNKNTGIHLQMVGFIFQFVYFMCCCDISPTQQQSPAQDYYSFKLGNPLVHALFILALEFLGGRR